LLSSDARLASGFPFGDQNDASIELIFLLARIEATFAFEQALASLRGSVTGERFQRTLSCRLRVTGAMPS
jgi:hypothetical protein